MTKTDKLSAYCWETNGSLSTLWFKSDKNGVLFILGNDVSIIPLGGIFLLLKTFFYNSICMVLHKYFWGQLRQTAQVLSTTTNAL